MRLAILDTNVVVSAGLKLSSVPFQLVADWVLAGRVQLVTCRQLSANIAKCSCGQSLPATDFRPRGWSSLSKRACGCRSSALDPFCAGREDAIFLALAHASGAWLVTGNLKHFPKPCRHGVTVLSPAEYLDHLGE